MRERLKAAWELNELKVGIKNKNNEINVDITLDKFAELKYNGINVELSSDQYTKAKNSNKIGKDETFDQWLQAEQDFKEHILGLTTVDGLKVGFTVHAIERMVGNSDLTAKGKIMRKAVGVEDIRDTLLNPLSVERMESIIELSGAKCSVRISKLGNPVTVIPNGKREV